ncbi:MAG TPA: pseudouridine synthase [Bacteroidia bacterium]|jgi:23S rRNA pseudouridine2605 synthase
MAKEFKRRTDKDLKGKRPFVDKKRKDDDKKAGSSERSAKSRTTKSVNKPSFERYRDESRPSDFGSSRKTSSSRPDSAGKERPAYKKKDTQYGEKSSDNSEKSFDKKDKPFDAEKKPFKGKKIGTYEGKKTGSHAKPETVKKSKTSANPFDLDDSDFEYGNEKPESDNYKKKEFKGRGYEKKPYVKKTWTSKGPSKPQKETMDDGSTRLNKYIANAGICSRREADALIASGVVQVNGKTITEMGYKVQPADIIKYGGQTLKKERLVYLILNKPKDYITTADDPQKRRTVLELIQGACKERIYPVGRLDRATTGLLMFTNDGDLTKKLTHPRYGVRKIYHVELDKPLKRVDLDKIAEGLELEDGPIKVDEITYVADGSDKTQVGVEIHSGKNRIVRRIFAHMGYNVRKLDRVMFGSLTKKDLPRGRWRLLTEAEIGILKMGSIEKD